MSNFPSTVPFKAVNFRVIDPTLISYSQSGKRVARKVNGVHKWSFTLSFPPMKKSVFRPLLGFIASLRGQFTSFTVIPPNLKTPLGTQLSDTAVAANASAGVTSISLSGGTNGKTLVEGDVIKFSNHTKVYVITTGATFVSGAASITITPPLVTDITTSHTVKHSNVPFTVVLTNPVQEFQTSVDDFYSYELDVEEDL